MLGRIYSWINVDGLETQYHHRGSSDRDVEEIRTRLAAGTCLGLGRRYYVQKVYRSIQGWILRDDVSSARPRVTLVYSVINSHLPIASSQSDL